MCSTVKHALTHTLHITHTFTDCSFLMGVCCRLYLVAEGHNPKSLHISPES